MESIRGSLEQIPWEITGQTFAAFARLRYIVNILLG